MIKLFKRIKFMLRFWKFIPFLIDYFLSTEVKFKSKVISVGLIAGYFIIPFDFVPDFLTFFGILDDIMIASFVLQTIVKGAPEGLKGKYGLDIE